MAAIASTAIIFAATTAPNATRYSCNMGVPSPDELASGRICFSDVRPPLREEKGAAGRIEPLYGPPESCSSNGAVVQPEQGAIIQYAARIRACGPHPSRYGILKAIERTNANAGHKKGRAWSPRPAPPSPSCSGSLFSARDSLVSRDGERGRCRAMANQSVIIRLSCAKATALQKGPKK